MIFSILSIMILVIVFVVSFILWGDFIYYSKNSKDNFYLRISISYSIGLCLFFVYYIVFSFLFNSLVSVYSFLILSTGLFFLRYSQIKINKKLFFYFVLIFVFLLVVVFSYWVNPLEGDSVNNPNQIIGSLHSGKYANIGSYILKTGDIPVINQNFGQSLLTSTVMILGFNSPLFILSVWLSFSLFFLLTLVYGFFKKLNFNKNFLIYAVIVVIFGGVSLSLSYVLVLDSGSPLLLNGYSDSINSFTSFLAFIFILGRDIFMKKRILINECLIFFLMFFSWGIYAPQNSIIGFFMLCVLVIYSYFRKGCYGNYSYVLLVVGFGILISLFFGGMLSPIFLIEDVNIPGLMKVSKENSSFISPGPVLPYIAPVLKGTNHSIWLYEDNKIIFEKGLNLNHGKIQGLIFLIERMFWDSLRVLFFPILGFVLMFFCLRKLNRFRESKNLKFYYFFLYSSLVCFLIGFIFSYFFIIGGRKFELSRFMIPGYYLGMICLVIGFYLFSFFIEKKYFYPLLILISIFLFMGNLLHFIQEVLNNLLNSHLGFFERIEIMIKLNGMVG